MVERYDQYIDSYGSIYEIEPDDDGDYVKYDDYATLAASHRRLVEAVRHLLEDVGAVRDKKHVPMVFLWHDDFNIKEALAEAEVLIGEVVK